MYQIELNESGNEVTVWYGEFKCGDAWECHADLCNCDEVE